MGAEMHHEVQQNVQHGKTTVAQPADETVSI
jgi:hypothetical protein